MNTALSALTPVRREYLAWVAWPISVGLVFLLCSISSPIFETNDDVHLSMIAHGYGIATGGSPRLVYSNVLWGYFIRLVPEIWGVPGYSLITEGWRARGCRTLIAQPTLRLSPSQPGHAVRACR